MAVDHDAVSESHTGTTGVASVASFTWDHVPSGTPRSALVFTVAIGANPVTGVTYGGTAMTAVPYTAYDTDTEPGFVQAWFLDNVASGTQAVEVSRTNNAVVTYAVCMTQTAATACEVYDAGVKTRAGSAAEQTAASSSSTGTASMWSSMSIDDGSPGTDSVRYVGIYGGWAAPSTARTGSTALISIDFGNYVAEFFRDTTPSQGAVTVGKSQTVSDDLAVIGLAVREAAASNVTVTPGAGSLTFTGAVPALGLPRTVTPDAGSVTVTGATPALKIGLTVTPGAGTVTITGATPALALPVGVQPAAGSLTVTGAVPSVTVGAGAGTTILPAAGTVTVTGAVPALLRPVSVQPAGGSVTFTGAVPALLRPVAALPGSASLVFTGHAPTVTVAGDAVTGGVAPTIAWADAPVPGASGWTTPAPTVTGTAAVPAGGARHV